ALAGNGEPHISGTRLEDFAKRHTSNLPSRLILENSSRSSSPHSQPHASIRSAELPSIVRFATSSSSSSSLTLFMASSHRSARFVTVINSNAPNAAISATTVAVNASTSSQAPGADDDTAAAAILVEEDDFLDSIPSDEFDLEGYQEHSQPSSPQGPFNTEMTDDEECDTTFVQEKEKRIPSHMEIDDFRYYEDSGTTNPFKRWLPSSSNYESSPQRGQGHVSKAPSPRSPQYRTGWCCSANSRPSQYRVIPDVVSI
ncbi:hypothetical protein BGX31_001682, partial [Mortierella sp. GBA43]